MMGSQPTSSQGIGLEFAAVNRTVSASTASTPAMLLTVPLCVEVSALARSILKTTSALVKGVPSWKVIPWRSSISQVSASSRFQLTASPGSSRPLPVVIGEALKDQILDPDREQLVMAVRIEGYRPATASPSAPRSPHGQARRDRLGARQGQSEAFECNSCAPPANHGHSFRAAALLQIIARSIRGASLNWRCSGTQARLGQRQTTGAGPRLTLNWQYQVRSWLRADHS